MALAYARGTEKPHFEAAELISDESNSEVGLN